MHCIFASCLALLKKVYYSVGALTSAMSTSPRTASEISNVIFGDATLRSKSQDQLNGTRAMKLQQNGPHILYCDFNVQSNSCSNASTVTLPFCC